MPCLYINILSSSEDLIKSSQYIRLNSLNFSTYTQTQVFECLRITFPTPYVAVKVHFLMINLSINVLLKDTKLYTFSEYIYL